MTRSFTSLALALGLTAGAHAAAARRPLASSSGAGKSAGSPAYNYMYQFPLPIPPIAQPNFTETVDGRTVQFYEATIMPFTQQVYPNLGPAHLTGYNGIAPGPTYLIEKGTETVIRYLNNGDVTAAVHLHGSYTHSAWDGWAADQMQVGQWKDYYYPNSESARSIWYHDHADGHTAADAYYGQAGAYIIYDPAEDVLALPSGKYDVPLALSDKIYQSNGDLASPNASPINFFGDVIQVNEQPWPYMATEPRKYRLRFFDMSLSRAYDLYFMDEMGDWIDFQVIASDSGLFGGPVSSNDLTIAMGERYEVVIDFAKYAGQNITLGNKLSNPQVTEFQNTNQVMMFVVGHSVSDNTNNGAVPSTLNGNIQWPAQRTTVDHSFNFQMGGDSTWTINGIDFNNVNNRILARPPQGTVELWELHHTGGPAIHPVHIHLINMQIVSRTGGTRGVLPYESAGLKDVVLLEPGETVRVLAYYGPWNGVYMFHCHNLIHEDHAMMDAFNVTKLEALGYEFNVSNSFSDPLDPRFVAQDYSPAAFEPAALTSAVLSLAELGAYASATQISAAQASYYATAGYHGDQYHPTTTTTVAASSSGYGFVGSSSPSASTAKATSTATTSASRAGGKGGPPARPTPTPTPKSGKNNGVGHFGRPFSA